MGNEEGGNRESERKKKAVIGGVGALLGIAVGVGGTILAQEVLSEKSTPKPRSVKSATQRPRVKETARQVPKQTSSVQISTTAARNQDDDPKELYCCPISGEIMEDPVITPSGITYDRKSIERWLLNKGVDPISKRPLRRDQLIPNRALKDSILEYKKKHHIQ